jgi:hypothetical protein
MCCLISIFYERAIPSKGNLFPDTTNLLTRARIQARNEGHLAAFLTACSRRKHFRQSRKTFGKKIFVYYLYPIIPGFVKQTSCVKGSASLLPLSLFVISLTFCAPGRRKKVKRKKGKRRTTQGPAQKIVSSKGLDYVSE